MRLAVMEPQFREDLEYWTRTDRRRALRVLKLLEATLRDPFEGLGEPGPLRGGLPDTWSRRVTHEHRLVYRVKDERVHFLAARYHY